MPRYMNLERTAENNLVVIYRLNDDGNIIYDEGEIMLLKTKGRTKIGVDTRSNFRVARYEVLEKAKGEDYRELKNIVDRKLGKSKELDRRAA